MPQLEPRALLQQVVGLRLGHPCDAAHAATGPLTRRPWHPDVSVPGDVTEPGAVLAVHPSLASACQLAPLLRRGQKPGFVVGDLTDLEGFGPIAGLEIPDSPLYLVHDIDRGDDLRSWSPTEALTALAERGRSPLTINEGISWLLQEPTMLEPNHCFMTIGSRKPTAKGLDARTPAICISGGTGRDGKENAGAPKVGWCWANNRHTWLGFASARTRSA